MHIGTYCITDARSFIAWAKLHRKQGYVDLPHDLWTELVLKLRLGSHLRTWITKNSRPDGTTVDTTYHRIAIWPDHMDLIIDL